MGQTTIYQLLSWVAPIFPPYYTCKTYIWMNYLVSIEIEQKEINKNLKNAHPFPAMFRMYDLYMNVLFS